jgi:hypothetical protein
VKVQAKNVLFSAFVFVSTSVSLGACARTYNTPPPPVPEEEPARVAIPEEETPITSLRRIGTDEALVAWAKKNIFENFVIDCDAENFEDIRQTVATLYHSKAQNPIPGFIQQILLQQTTVKEPVNSAGMLLLRCSPTGDETEVKFKYAVNLAERTGALKEQAKALFGTRYLENGEVRFPKEVSVAESNRYLNLLIDAAKRTKNSYARLNPALDEKLTRQLGSEEDLILYTNFGPEAVKTKYGILPSCQESSLVCAAGMKKLLKDKEPISSQSDMDAFFKKFAEE